jgi:hypothetical protein
LAPFVSNCRLIIQSTKKSWAQRFMTQLDKADFGAE